MAPLISREELALVLGEDIPEDRFAAVYAMAVRAIRSAYKGDPEEATGDAEDTVIGVLQSVVVRILTNPKGARTVGLGSANVTFGGPDVEIARVFLLTEDERAELAAVSPGRRTGAFTINPLARP